MKKALIFSVIIAFIMIVAAPVLAGDLSASIDKISDGVTDVVKSPLALYDNTKIEMDEADNLLIGLLTGLIKAPFHMIKEAGHGVMKIVTFPID